MDINGAAEWAIMRACKDFREDGSCSHDACLTAKEVHDLLQSAVWIDTREKDGTQVKGWLIPAQN